MKKTLSDIEKNYEASPAGAARLRGLQQTLAHIGNQRSASLKIPDSGTTLRFGLIGDRHYGNTCCDIPAIAAYYAEVAKMGITEVLDAGDMLDGHKVYRGQEFELQDVGIDKQSKRFADTSPAHSGITTHFITGNHDASFTRSVGVSVGDKLAQLRSDHKFLGADTASIELTNKSGTKIKVALIHPDGGSSYAISYKPQKIVEQLEGGTKPDILGIGHFHKADFIPSYRNVAVLQTGTFERQTPFMARNGLAAHVGGWIIEAAKNKSGIRVKAEFIGFY